MLLVLYPDPARLASSIGRAWSPPVDPLAVRELAAQLPDDPAQIERIVNSTLVPYAVPWETYSVPWYFPTPREVLEHGEGDCQARAVVFASILRAKGIPARFAGSFDHLWVEYPGKQPTELENAALVLAVQQDDGGYSFRLPHLVDWRASWAIERAYFLDAMPVSRAGLLLGGWALILARPRPKLFRPRLSRGLAALAVSQCGARAIDGEITTQGANS